MDGQIIFKECLFKAVKSSGPGGQHVNKTSSKVELHFNIAASQGLSSKEKELLLKNLKSKISSEATLSLSSSQTRSQHRNKALVFQRLVDLLKENLKQAKARKKTRLSKSIKEKRSKAKKEHSIKKSLRKPPSLE